MQRVSKERFAQLKANVSFWDIKIQQTWNYDFETSFKSNSVDFELIEKSHVNQSGFLITEHFVNEL